MDAGAGCRYRMPVPGTGCPMPGTGCPMPDAGAGGAGCRWAGAGCRLPVPDAGAGCRMPVPDTGGRKTKNVYYATASPMLFVRAPEPHLLPPPPKKMPQGFRPRPCKKLRVRADPLVHLVDHLVPLSPLSVAAPKVPQPAPAVPNT